MPGNQQTWSSQEHQFDVGFRVSRWLFYFSHVSLDHGLHCWKSIQLIVAPIYNYGVDLSWPRIGKVDKYVQSDQDLFPRVAANIVSYAYHFCI